MTKPKRYKRYSAEFKREAIRRANAEGVTDAEVCDELGISTRQFRRWRDELALLGNDAFPGPAELLPAARPPQVRTGWYRSGIPDRQSLHTTVTQGRVTRRLAV